MQCTSLEPLGDMGVALPGVTAIRCQFDPIHVVALPMPVARVRAMGVVLPEGRDALAQHGADSAAANDGSLADELHGVGGPANSVPMNVPQMAGQCGNLGNRFTRIAPPRDVVKLEDRLSYWLQPPLEKLLESDGLKLAAQPFDFQLDGISFLYARHEAVLADEMGLGKTMQTVLALRLLMHHGRARRALLVCPKPLISNWRNEFSTWAPDVPFSVLEGNEAARRWTWRHAATGVLAVNYELLVRDAAEAADVSPQFDVVVLDEAQRIKNASSAANHATRSIPRARSWALTGTPIENGADDLAGIFQFVAPGRLRPQMPLPRLRDAVSDHILRRTKDQVLDDLPPRMMRDAELALSPEQQEAYTLAEEEGVVYLKELGEHATVQHVFQLVTRLKQICNFDPATGVSSKMERLAADLEECAASGRKAIVFSQWVGAIEQIAANIAGRRPLQYHGRIAPSRRDEVVRQFREDSRSSVLLMSYGAGGVGLNLQFASYVFLFDRWWNPAVEDQAINRAHRIGAAEPVTVTRFLTLGTIEQRIDALLTEKREQFAALFDGASAGSSQGLSRAEVLGLFGAAAEKAA